MKRKLWPLLRPGNGSLTGEAVFLCIMKTLEPHFKQGGYELLLCFREGMIAVYRKSKATRGHYETVRIQSHNGYILCGVEYPPSEFYPSSEQWGVHGFTYMDYTAALAKAYEMAAAEKAREEKK